MFLSDIGAKLQSSGLDAGFSPVGCAMVAPASRLDRGPVGVASNARARSRSPVSSSPAMNPALKLSTAPTVSTGSSAVPVAVRSLAGSEGDGAGHRLTVGFGEVPQRIRCPGLDALSSHVASFVTMMCGATSPAAIWAPGA